MGESPKRFGISSWSDVAALGSLLLLGIGYLNWNLKLESEINEQRAQQVRFEAEMRREITELKKQVGNGILPRAEERIKAIERRLDREDESP